MWLPFADPFPMRIYIYAPRRRLCQVPPGLDSDGYSNSNHGMGYGITERACTRLADQSVAAYADTGVMWVVPRHLFLLYLFYGTLDWCGRGGICFVQSSINNFK